MIAPQRQLRLRRVLAAWLATLLAPTLMSLPAGAKVPQLSVTPLSDLRFGGLVAFGNGSRTVTATGSVLDSGILPGLSGDIGPALFMVAYDRGNESKRTLNLRIEVVLSEPPALDASGISARVSGFDTDLPAVGRIQPGRPFTITIPNCAARVCSATFAVGGRLDLTRNHGGADLRFPLAMDALLVSTD